MRRNSIHTIVGSLLLLAGLCTVASQAPAQQGSNDPDKKKEDPLVKEAVDLFLKNKGPEAAKKYEEAVKNDPTLAPYELLLAEILLQNRKAEYRQLLEMALAKNQDHPRPWLLNASVALAEGRIQEAITNCQLALNAASQSRWTKAQSKLFQKDAHQGLAAAFENRGNWDAARNSLETLSDFEPTNAQILVRLARAQFMTGKEKDSLDSLKKANELDATLEPAEVAYAQFQSQKVEPGKNQAEQDANQLASDKKAEEWFQKALKLYPTKAKPALAYGGWLLDKGRIDDAKTQISAAEKLEATSADASITRQKAALFGLLARYERNYPLAVKHFDAMQREDATDFFAANQLALALIEGDEKQKKRAVAIAEVNAKANEKSAEARATLAWCYFQSKRYEEAERQFEAAVSSRQIMPDTAYYLSKLQFHKDKFEDAYRTLKKALDTKGVFVNRKDAKAFFEKDVNVKATKEVKDAVAKEEKEAAAAGSTADNPPKKKEEPPAVVIPKTKM